jgi:excisionase family DNA binding protein
MEYYGTAEAAKELGISQVRVRQLCQSGRLGQFVLGRYLITKEDLVRFRKIPRIPGRPSSKD